MKIAKIQHCKKYSSISMAYNWLECTTHIHGEISQWGKKLEWRMSDFLSVLSPSPCTMHHFLCLASPDALCTQVILLYRIFNILPHMFCTENLACTIHSFHIPSYIPARGKSYTVTYGLFTSKPGHLMFTLVYSFSYIPQQHNDLESNVKELCHHFCC